eukprot:g14436.t2
MEGRAPYGGRNVLAAGAAEPTIETLGEVTQLLAARKKWPAFLHGEWANNDFPEDVREALEWMASRAVGRWASRADLRGLQGADPGGGGGGEGRR